MQGKCLCRLQNRFNTEMKTTFDATLSGNNMVSLKPKLMLTEQFFPLVLFLLLLPKKALNLVELHCLRFYNLYRFIQREIQILASGTCPPLF